MNALLPYLKEIAEILEGMTAGSGTASSGRTTVSGTASFSAEGISFAGISDSIEAGLVATITEEGEQEGETVSVQKPMMEVMKDEIVDELHKAFFVTVTETVPGEQEGDPDEEVEVEKSVFEVLKDDISEI